MSQPHRAVRTSKSRPRKFNGHCEECGKSICICKAYQYVDGNNAAITNNSPYLCIQCAEKRYGIKIPSPEQAYRDRLVSSLERLYDRLKEDEKDLMGRIIGYINHFD